MANPKCKYCGKELKRKTAYKEEYIQTGNLKIANRYFCDEECYKKFHLQDTIKDNFYQTCSEVLGDRVAQNWNFKKRVASVPDKEKIFLVLYKKKEEFLLDYESKISAIKSKKEVNINYEIAVFVNMLVDYSNRYENLNVEEETETTTNKVIAELDDYIDYESAMPRGIQVKPRKTIFDFDD